MPDLPGGWLWKNVGEIAEVRGGIQKQPKRTPRRNPFPYLRVANVLRNRLDLRKVEHMELFNGELETYRLRPGDLLIVEGNGSITEIGRSALWSGEISDCVHQNHIIRVRAQGCLPEYLNLYCNSPKGIETIAGHAVTTAGLFSLSTRKVSELPIPLPPLDEQGEIVRRTVGLMDLADRIDIRLHAEKQRIGALTQSILAQAFRGELVPTEAELAPAEGRIYESAAELLSRIRVECQLAIKRSAVNRRARPS